MRHSEAGTARRTDVATARSGADDTRATARGGPPDQGSRTEATARAGPPDPTTRTKATRRGGPSEPAPLVLGRYSLHRRLGSGAFGTVWMASDERLERHVAVKILPRERVMGGRFEREARAAARLSHPGIVTLYEATVDDEGAYLVSELVRGPTLDKLLAAGRLSDQDIVRIGLVLCDALEHAHDEGIVHRDVKPSNILVPQRPNSPSQLAKLTDFGVARVVGGDTLTRTGDVIGTLAYMAPEQAEGLEAGPEADLYSLALVLYEALTGVNPVAASGSGRPRRLGTYLAPLRRQRRDLPRELGQGIDMALRPRPRERGRIADLRRALMAARDQVGDEVGIVTDAWAPRERHPDQASETWARPPPSQAEADPADVPRLAWPARGAGALAAALTTAWLATHTLAPSPVQPALAALIAGGACLVLPRLGWLGLTLGITVTALAQGHSGLAIVAALALVTPMLLMPLTPQTWPLSAGAPALGLLGLAGAWPAAAGLAGSVWRRAALGAAGWLWLFLAAPVAGRTLYLNWLPGGSRGAWASSPQATISQVLGPLLHSGALAPALVWALAAAVLPWLVRGRSLAVDVVLVVVWSATVASATTAAVSMAHGATIVPAAPAALAGAVLGAVIAIAPAWLPARTLGWSRRVPGSLGAHFP